MEDFTVVHHFKNDLESFLAAEAEILGEILAEALEDGELNLTTDDQA